MHVNNISKSRAETFEEDKLTLKTILPQVGLEPAIPGFHDQCSNPLSHQGSSAGWLGTNPGYYNGSVNLINNKKTIKYKCTCTQKKPVTVGSDKISAPWRAAASSLLALISRESYLAHVSVHVHMDMYTLHAKI